MQQLATSPLTVHQVWNKGFKLARERLYPLYFLFIINQIIIALSVYLFTGPNKTLAAVFKEHPLNAVIFFIVTGLISLFIYSIGFHQLGTLMQGRAYNFKDSVQAMLKKFPILVLACILSLLVVAIGFAALIIPGIFIGIALFFYYPAIIIDDMSPIAALQHTFKLVWGNWWRSFYVVIAPIFMAGIIGGLFTLIMFIIGLIIPAINAHIADHLTTVFTVLFQAFVDVVVISIQLVQWNDLKIRKQLINT